LNLVRSGATPADHKSTLEHFNRLEHVLADALRNRHRDLVRPLLTQTALSPSHCLSRAISKIWSEQPIHSIHSLPPPPLLPLLLLLLQVLPVQ
jgi:hypothetical protein